MQKKFPQESTKYISLYMGILKCCEITFTGYDFQSVEMKKGKNKPCDTLSNGDLEGSKSRVVITTCTSEQGGHSQNNLYASTHTGDRQRNCYQAEKHPSSADDKIRKCCNSR